MRFLTLSSTLLFCVPVSSLLADENHHSHHDDFDVQPFFVEPADRHNALIFDYGFRSGDEGNEHEIGFELEYAFNERFGVILEQGFLFLDGSEGLGDLAVVPRVFLVESESFYLTANLEVEIPTGDSTLTSDEVALAPSLSARWDVDGGWAVHGQFGVETALDSDETELFTRIALIHGVGASDKLAMILESEFAVGVGGDESGDVHAEGVVGLSYAMRENFATRLGFQFPISSPREFDAGFIVGGVFTF
ncbi:MAG: hypothetical protein ACI8UO_003036 [Verrucomicrobiales bacterium]|jgi:hypothetical protein